MLYMLLEVSQKHENPVDCFKLVMSIRNSMPERPRPPWPEIGLWEVSKKEKKKYGTACLVYLSWGKSGAAERIMMD